MKLHHLDWDSDFFHKKIGRIDYDYHQENILLTLLNESLNLDYELVYLFCPQDIFIPDNILNKYSGKLVDRKVLYTKEVTENNCPSISFRDTNINIVRYDDGILCPELEQLTYLSGKYSRFRNSDYFSEDDFQKLYKTWMVKSINGEIADSVYVVKEKSEIMGMITLKHKMNRSEIGLISVSESAQGKHYGSNLISTCVKDVILKENGWLDVPTQMENKTACKFYEKQGFYIKSITNIYHFKI